MVVSSHIWWHTLERNHIYAVSVIKLFHIKLIWNCIWGHFHVKNINILIWLAPWYWREPILIHPEWWSFFCEMVALSHVWWHTLERNHINATSVIKIFFWNGTFKPYLMMYTLKRNHINVLSVIKFAHIYLIWNCIWGYTLENNHINALKYLKIIL